MQTFKKIVLILGPIVLVVGLYYTFFRDQSPIPGTVQLVNVLTGKLEQIPQSKLGMIPAPDPSGRCVLYPIHRDDAGKVTVGERYRIDLLNKLKSKELTREEIKIDLSSFAVPPQ